MLPDAIARSLIELDRRGLRWAMCSPSAANHRRLATLSNLADHSKLWLAVGAVEVAVGGRAGRRAALRGLVSIAGSSVIVNAGLKSLLPRRRPPILDGLASLVRRPSSSSFPSGHSASAAAFATATALEAPLLAGPAAALAGLVGFSRASTGVHYPSDIVVGAAIGSLISLLTKPLWPRRRLEEDGAPSPLVLRPTERCLSGEGLVVVVNGAAGSGEGDDEVDAIVEAFPRAEIVRFEADDDIELVMSGVAARAGAVGVLGGDGTVSAAAQAAVDDDTPLAVFPGGTLNHFARDLGIESLDDTVNALRSGTLTLVDSGRIDGIGFINTASFGTYSEFVARREALEPKIGKWAAMVLAVAQVFATGKPIEATINGETMSVWMIFIGNGVYRPLGFVPSSRDRLDDGCFDLRIVGGSVRFARVRLLASLGTRRLDRSAMYHQQIVDRVSVATAHRSLQLAADGELFTGSGTFEVEKRSVPLQVYVNQRQPNDGVPNRLAERP